jgi:hypothetical protein
VWHEVLPHESEAPTVCAFDLQRGHRAKPGSRRAFVFDCERREAELSTLRAPKGFGEAVWMLFERGLFTSPRENSM